MIIKKTPKLFASLDAQIMVMLVNKFDYLITLQQQLEVLEWHLRYCETKKMG